MKKDTAILILLFGLIAWNVWLSLPKKEDEKINYELFQELYQQSKRRESDFDNKVVKYSEKHEKDSNFVYSASRHERDSMRAELNSPY